MSSQVRKRVKLRGRLLQQKKKQAFAEEGSGKIKKAEERKRREDQALGEAVNTIIMSTIGGPKDKADFTETMIETYKELFNLFDRNKDGSISIDELGHVFKIHLGKSLSESDLSKIIETVDENNSKTIEFGEFLSLMASETWSEIEKSEIIKAFAVFDRNKDGYVDSQELHYALTNYGEAMTEEEATELLNIVDLDKNGLIDYSEFEHMMQADEGMLDCRQQ